MVIMDHTKIIEECLRYRDDPLGFTKWCFPRSDAPADRWNDNILPYHEELFKQVEGDRFVIGINNRSFDKLRFFIWVAVWFISTRPFSQVCFTSGSDGSLELLWSHLERWSRIGENRGLFKCTRDQVYLPPHKWSWGIHRVPYIEGHCERYAGCFSEHALVVIDEADSVESEVFEVLSANTPNLIVAGLETKHVVREFKKWTKHLNTVTTR